MQNKNDRIKKENAQKKYTSNTQKNRFPLSFIHLYTYTYIHIIYVYSIYRNT